MVAASTQINSAVRRILLVIVLSGVFASACSDEQAEAALSQRLIEQSLNQKLDGWRSRRSRDCHRQALDLALRLADSMVLDYAHAERMMLARPARPVRPLEPELLRPADSLALEPFLTDSM